MDKKRIGLIAVLVVLMGVIFMTLNNRDAPEAVVETKTETIIMEVDYASVLTVESSMAKGSRIMEGDLVWMDWPAEAVTPALIMDDPDAELDPRESLIGAFARDPLIPGEPLTPSKLIRAGEAGIMAALLKPGMRAVTVRISVDSASGGFIQPGDKVDIIMRRTEDSIMSAKTIFENVMVLAIDQSFTNNPETGAAIPGSTATLELSPGDSETLIVSQARGDLSLVLRGFSGSNAPARSKASVVQTQDREIPPLTIYRSGAVQTVQVQGSDR